MVETLEAGDVRVIHDVLARDFARSADPISPAGVRSDDLLESAVARQHTSIGGIHKYADPKGNAAALTYGLCCNHPFHNGNKRTALVSMLVHLDRNRYVLRETTNGALFELMLRIADHTMAPKKHGRHDPDAEVLALQEWLHKRVTKVERWEKPITGRELRRILRRFGLELENPNSNMMDVVRYEETKGKWLFGRPGRRAVRICRIGWHHEGGPVSQRDVRQLRRLAELDEEHGVDAKAFYDDEAVADAFINQYRKVLTRLAKR